MKKLALFLSVIFMTAATCHAELIIPDEELSRKVTYVVELKEPSDKNSPSLFAIEEITTPAEAMQTLCEKEAIEPGHIFSQIFNGFSVIADESLYEEILNTPGVKNVYKIEPLEIIKPLVEEASDTTGVTYIHDEDNEGYTGAGEVIAILDNEFDVSHEFFGVAPKNPTITPASLASLITTEGFTKNIDPAKAYVSEKIPFAYDYGESDYTLMDYDLIASNDYHGTHVAGIAAGNNASADDGEPVRGTAPDAQLLLMKISSPEYKIDTTAVLKAFEDAVLLGATSINMSFGSNYSSPSSQYFYETLISRARALGITVCCASGNSSRGYDNTYNSKAEIAPENIDYGSIGTPAASYSSTAVAASNKNRTIGDYTSWGVSESLELKPDITVPGSSLLSSKPGGGYVSKSGTSMASPHMAGISSLMSEYLKSSGFTYTNETKVTLIENLLMSTADVIKTNGIAVSPRQQGAGIANLLNATKTKVILKGDDGKTKLSLGDTLTDTLNISFTIANMSDTDLTYNLSFEVCTDAAVGGKIASYPVKIPVISHTLPETVTVSANSTIPIEFTAVLDSEFLAENAKIFTNGFYIDGFVYLTHDNAPSLNIPFTGFCGNWSKQNVFDRTVYDTGGSLLRKNGVGGTFLFTTATTNNVTRNIYLGTDALTNKFDKKYIAISPNDDGYGDVLGISFQNMRAVQRLDFTLHDSEGDSVSLGSLFDILSKFISASITTTSLFSLPEGDYSISIRGIFNYDGAENYPNTISMPFSVDRTAPVFKDMVLSPDRSSLTVTATDNHYISSFRIKYTDTSGGSHSQTLYPDTSRLACGDDTTVTFTLTNPDLSNITIDCKDYAYNNIEQKYSEEIYVNSVLNENYLSYEVINNAESSFDAEIIAAFYDENGKLVYTAFEEVTAAVGEVPDSLEITEDISSAAYYKLLLWDSLTSASPIIPYTVFNLN